MFRFPLITLITLSLLHGQGFWLVNGRTHAELRWQVISTEHFNIIYHQGLDSVARRSAAIAEQVYQPIMDQLELDDFGTTDLVLTAEDEIANGFALPSNRIFIWALQNDAAGRHTGSRKWLSTVIAHEFQHVALFNGLKTWLGVWNFPWVPLWFVEGTAEYYTETWRVGRSDNQLKIHTYKNIMDRLDPHDAGYAKLLYMADKYGDSTITRIVHYRDPVKVGGRVLFNQPYRFGRAFQQVTGQSLDQFNEEWRRAMHTTYYSVRGQKEGVDEVGEPVILPRLAAIRGLSFSPDSSRVAVVGRADQGMGDWSLYVVSTDSTQRRVEVSYGYFGDRPAWSPDGKSLAVAQFHRGRNGSLLWDIRIIDVQDRRARWLTRNARAADPVWSLDGESILYVAHSGEATNLYLADIKGGKAQAITAFTGDVQVQDPTWSPDGASIAFAVQEVDGYMDIAVVGSGGAGYMKVTHDPQVDLAPLWSADGQWIIFTSYRDGAANLYRVPVSGGAISPMTDVAEGLTAIQIMPKSGAVVALTLGDVDTVRVRQVPPNRTVEPDTVIMRDPYARWRQGRPAIPLPEIDFGQVPATTGPVPYHWRRSWRPLARLVVPTFTGIAGLGYWSDVLGKNQLLVAGGVDVRRRDWGGVVSWINTSGVPFVTLTGYRKARIRVRGFGDGYLLEEMSGVEAGIRYPFNLGRSLSDNHSLAVFLRASQRRPTDVFAVDPLARLGPPLQVTESGIAAIYQLKAQRPHRSSAYLPRQGSGLQIRFDLTSSLLFGNWDYSKGEVELFTHRRIPRTPLVLFLRGLGTALAGDPPPQDRTGLLTDAPVYLNPGSALGIAGGLVETVNLHSPRGLESSYLALRVVSGTAELRLPLVGRLPVSLLGLSLGQLTAAVYTDFGQAFGPPVAGAASPFIITRGAELKVNLMFGKLPLFTLAYGTAGEWFFGSGTSYRPYLRLGLVSPF